MSRNYISDELEINCFFFHCVIVFSQQFLWFYSSICKHLWLRNKPHIWFFALRTWPKKLFKNSQKTYHCSSISSSELDHFSFAKLFLNFQSRTWKNIHVPRTSTVCIGNDGINKNKNENIEKGSCALWPDGFERWLISDSVNRKHTEYQALNKRHLRLASGSAYCSQNALVKFQMEIPKRFCKTCVYRIRIHAKLG